MAKISSSMFLSFLRKLSFNLCLKLLSEFTNFKSVGKLFETIGGRYNNFFHQNKCFLKDVLVSKQKISYLLDFDQIVYIYHENIHIFL